jgi:hypothetical protein
VTSRKGSRPQIVGGARAAVRRRMSPSRQTTEAAEMQLFAKAFQAWADGKISGTAEDIFEAVNAVLELCNSKEPHSPVAEAVALTGVVLRERKTKKSASPCGNPRRLTRLILLPVYSQMSCRGGLRWHNASSNPTPSVRALRWLLR